MSLPERAAPASAVPHTSWPLATWVVPVVPTLVLWLLVLVDRGERVNTSSPGSGTAESVGYLTALCCALAVGAVGWLLFRTHHPRLRGLGLGLTAGGAVTALVLLAAVVR